MQHSLGKGHPSGSPDRSTGFRPILDGIVYGIRVFWKTSCTRLNNARVETVKYLISKKYIILIRTKN
jgi:hypothetical protein